MQRVVLENGGDYPANEYIIGSGHNAFYADIKLKREIYQIQTN